MVSMISVLIFISAMFSAVAGLRILIRASLILTYFAAELARGRRRSVHTPLHGLNFPTTA